MPAARGRARLTEEDTVDRFKIRTPLTIHETVEGEVVMRTDAGEYVLRAGECAGWPAGDRNGHQLINKSDRPVRYLEVSNRHPEDSAEYTDPDVDMAYRKGPDGGHQFTRPVENL